MEAVSNLSPSGISFIKKLKLLDDASSVSVLNSVDRMSSLLLTLTVVVVAPSIFVAVVP